ncbi:hypothetical protein M2444_004311 [Paenibacillus sp. PastF-3]|jgi:hypothetical protein|nr:hypothetical protein [Paenibacillus sp. PastF-3]
MKQLGDESFAVDWNPDIPHEKNHNRCFVFKW